MPTESGDYLRSHRISGQRIATRRMITNSDDITGGHTEVLDIAADLIAGETYRVSLETAVAGTDGNRWQIELREPDFDGDEFQSRVNTVTHSGGFGSPAHVEGEFMAQENGSHAFVVTLRLVNGSGNVHLAASDQLPTWLYVDYIR